MVLYKNEHYHVVVKFMNNFLEKTAPEEVLAQWKQKHNLQKLKTTLQKLEGPVKPRRLMSKYLYFCQRVRSQVVAENPTLTIREVTCEIGRRWQEFKNNPDPRLDKELEKEFMSDKQRYEEEKKKYVYFQSRVRPQIIMKNPKLTGRQIEQELYKQWETFKNNPDSKLISEIQEDMNLKEKQKKSKSLYIYFCDLERKKDENKPTMKELGKRWAVFKHGDEYQKLKNEYDAL